MWKWRRPAWKLKPPKFESLSFSSLWSKSNCVLIWCTSSDSLWVFRACRTEFKLYTKVIFLCFILTFIYNFDSIFSSKIYIKVYRQVKFCNQSFYSTIFELEFTRYYILDSMLVWIRVKFPWIDFSHPYTHTEPSTKPSRIIQLTPV